MHGDASEHRPREDKIRLLLCTSISSTDIGSRAPENPGRGTGSSARFGVGWLTSRGCRGCCAACLCFPFHWGLSAAIQRAKCRSGRCFASARKTQPTFSSFPAFTTRCHWKSSIAPALCSSPGWEFGGVAALHPLLDTKHLPSLLLHGFVSLQSLWKNHRRGFRVQWILKCN